MQLEPSPQGSRSSEADERREEIGFAQGSTHPNQHFFVCFRTFTQLFQRVVVGAHRQPTREIKVLVFVTHNFTARISIRDDRRPQSASKQAHRYHYIIITYTSWDHAIWRTK